MIGKNLKVEEKGFTLLETLLVLMITSSLLLFSVLSIKNVTETIQIDLFFRELTSKITNMQTHAILHDQTTDIQFYPQNNVIKFRVVDANAQNEFLKETWELDNPYYRLSGTSIKEFAFKKGSGNITKSDRIYIHTTKGEYELVYLMGSGRFEIRERN